VAVFLPTTVTPAALERQLESGLGPGVDVLVYGRFSDFASAIRGQSPNAILTSATVLDALSLPTHVQGVRGGQVTEQWLLVSVGDTLDRVAPEQVRYGALDMVGREGLPTLVARLLGLSRRPQVVRVVKYADLLPVLQFGEADAVLVPQRILDDFTSKSRLRFRVERVSTARIKRPGVSFTGPERHDIASRLRHLDPAVRELLGVDGWVEPRGGQP